MKQELASYIIKGGEEGRIRLGEIARTLAPSTRLLLDRFEPLKGRLVIDAGCGGGDVSFELAQRVGATGRVIGIDLDESKLTLAREEAARCGISNVEFRNASVLHPWQEKGVSLIYARFVLTHLTDPSGLLHQAQESLARNGVMVIEDIDYGGEFSDPPCAGFARYDELYIQAALRRGADPFIGRKLVRLLEGAGFSAVDSSLVQPFGRGREVKQIFVLTFAAISDALMETGLVSREEVAKITSELQVAADSPDITLGWPRIFQAWGRKR